MDQNTNQNGSQQGNNSQATTIFLVADQTVVLNFGLNDIAELNVNGNDLIFTLNSGEEFVLEDYATLGKEIEAIEFAGGEVIPGDAYLNDFGDIDTAAGPGAGTTVGGGVGSPEAPDTSLNDSLSKIGPQPDIFTGDPVEFDDPAIEGLPGDGTPFVRLNLDFDPTNLVVDETFLDGGELSIAVDFSTAFISGFGPDGPGSETYSLDLVLDGVDSGLFALGLAGAAGDRILVQQLDDTDTIVGYTGEGESYQEYFHIEMDDFGVITFTQLQAIYHPQGGDAHDDLVRITMNSADLLTLTKIVVDVDGDIASAVLPLGQGVFGIEDDGPVVVALDETAEANVTEDDGFDVATIESSVIAGLFAVPDFGEDGPGNLNYFLNFEEGFGTGLWLTGQSGEVDEITLQAGESGSVAGIAGDGTIAFTVGIDSVSGEVTIEQLETLDHPNTEDHNDIVAINGIAVTQIIVDADGDIDTATSTALTITVTDDGPNVEARVEGWAGVNLTEGVGEPFYPDDGDNGIFEASAIAPAVADTGLDTVFIDSQVIQSLFVASDFGADGPGGVTYSLTITDLETGLYLTGQRVGEDQPIEISDVEQGGVDPQIILQSNEDGTLIQGVAGGGEVAFTIAIDPETGEVTVAQLLTLDHPNVQNHHDILGLTGVAVTQTIVDGDGDTDSATSDDLDITFTDDGPIAANDANSIGEDYLVPIEGNLFENDTLGADAPAKVTDVTGFPDANVGNEFDTQYGSILIREDGTYVYSVDNTNHSVQQLDTDETLTETLTYIVTDGDGDSDDAILRITINGSDDPLVAVDDVDSFSAAQAQSTITGVTNVLSNDEEPDTTDLPLSVDDTAAQDVYLVNSDGTLSSTVAGTITIAADGGYSLDLNAVTKAAAVALDDQESLRVGVEYTAINSDTVADSDDAILRITINGSDDPLVAVDDVDSFSAAQAQSTITGVTNVLSNDEEPDTTDLPLSVDDTAAQDVYLVNSDGTLSSTVAGTITIAADGGYSLDLNAVTKAAAVALDDQESLRVGVEYTAINSDTVADSDDAILRITINGANDLPTVMSDPAVVSEEDLDDGIEDDDGNPTDTDATTYFVGTFTATDPEDGIILKATINPDDSTYPDLSSGDVDLDWTLDGGNTILIGSAGGEEVIRFTLNDDGTYRVDLSGPLDHAIGQEENLLEFDIPIQVEDSSGGVVDHDIHITVEDDSPIGENFEHALEIQPQHTNLMFIVDTSGSMAWDADTGSSTTVNQERMELLLNSMRDVITSYDNLGDIRVQIITFDSVNSDGTDDSTARAIWLTAAEALALIGDGTPRTALNPDGRDPVFEPDGGTDYDLAVSTAESGFANPGKLVAAEDYIVKNVSYFLSDGQPQTAGGIENSDGITGDEIDNWTDFLTTNYIDSYAVGFGSGLTQADRVFLDPLAYDGVEAAAGNTTEAERNGVIVSQADQLADELLSTVYQPIEGFIFDEVNGAGFGADGGAFLDITIDNDVYAWVGADNNGQGQVYKNGIALEDDGGNIIVGNSTIIQTAQGGELWIDFSTGKYKYIPEPEMPLGSEYTETFTYRIEDRDGDIGQGSVDLNISRGEGPVVDTASLAHFAVEDHLLVSDDLILVDGTDYDFSVTTTGYRDTNTFEAEAGGEFTVDFKVTGASGDDVLGIALYRQITFPSGDTYSWEIEENVLTKADGLANGNAGLSTTFEFSQAGTYFVRVRLDDGTASGSGKELKVAFNGIFYSQAGAAEWQGAIPAEGNLFGAYDFGNDDEVEIVLYYESGVVVPFINGEAVIIGDSGTLTVYEATGDYRYDPFSEVDYTGNPTESFSFDLIQGNTIVNSTLDFEIKDHVGGTSGDDENADAITGTDSNEALYGFAGDDEIDGGAGNDIIDGGIGLDILNGGEGDDILYGGDKGGSVATEGDTLTGGEGDDIFIAAKGDTLNLADVVGDDTIYIGTEMVEQAGEIVTINDFVSGQDALHFEEGLTLAQGTGLDADKIIVTSGANTMTLQFDGGVDLSSIISDASNPTPEEIDVVNSIINSNG